MSTPVTGGVPSGNPRQMALGLALRAGAAACEKLCSQFSQSQFQDIDRNALFAKNPSLLENFSQHNVLELAGPANLQKSDTDVFLQTLGVKDPVLQVPPNLQEIPGPSKSTSKEKPRRTLVLEGATGGKPRKNFSYNTGFTPKSLFGASSSGVWNQTMPRQNRYNFQQAAHFSSSSGDGGGSSVIDTAAHVAQTVGENLVASGSIFLGSAKAADKFLKFEEYPPSSRLDEYTIDQVNAGLQEVVSGSTPIELEGKSQSYQPGPFISRFVEQGVAEFNEGNFAAAEACFLKLGNYLTGFRTAFEKGTMAGQLQNFINKEGGNLPQNAKEKLPSILAKIRKHQADPESPQYLKNCLHALVLTGVLRGGIDINAIANAPNGKAIIESMLDGEKERAEEAKNSTWGRFEGSHEYQDHQKQNWQKKKMIQLGYAVGIAGIAGGFALNRERRKNAEQRKAIAGQCKELVHRFTHETRSKKKVGDRLQNAKEAGAKLEQSMRDYESAKNAMNASPDNINLQEKFKEAKQNYETAIVECENTFKLFNDQFSVDMGKDPNPVLDEVFSHLLGAEKIREKDQNLKKEMGHSPIANNSGEERLKRIFNFMMNIGKYEMVFSELENEAIELATLSESGGTGGKSLQKAVDLGTNIHDAFEQILEPGLFELLSGQGLGRIGKAIHPDRMDSDNPWVEPPGAPPQDIDVVLPD